MENNRRNTYYEKHKEKMKEYNRKYYQANKIEINMNKKVKRKRRRYAVYAVYKGDEFGNIGTIDELAKIYNVAKGTVTYWTSPINIRRINARKTEGKSRVAIRVE